jgi:hypothetical protein
MIFGDIESICEHLRHLRTNRMFRAQKKAAIIVERPRPSYFKLPADCDDEESLEERRGRTVLRTAM